MAYTIKFLFVFSSIVMLLISACHIAYGCEGNTFKHGMDESDRILETHQHKQTRWKSKNILSNSNEAKKVSISNSRDQKQLAMEKPSSWVIHINTSGYYNLTSDITDCSNDTAIYITASDVILDGCGHVVDGTPGSDSKWGIYVENAENVTIKNVIISEWYYAGIYFYNSSGFILNNTIQYNDYYGVCLYNSSNNTISNNTFNNDGIFVWYSYNNTVENNTVDGKPLVYMENVNNVQINWSTGQIVLVRCENITITNQSMQDIEVGIELWETNNTEIYDTYMWSTFDVGICLYFSHGNKIHNNTILNSWSGGIYISNSTANKIYDNHIQGSWNVSLFILSLIHI